jgi:integrase
MPRGSRSAELDSPTKRERLGQGDELDKEYQEPLGDGRYLCYRKRRKSMSGVWSARRYDPETRRIVQTKLGDADDRDAKAVVKADGVKVLTYIQARQMAEAWCARQGAPQAAGQAATGPYTVQDAWNDYLRDAERRGVKGTRIMSQVANARILPQLGEIEVANLTKGRLEDWKEKLVKEPPRTGKKEPKEKIYKRQFKVPRPTKPAEQPTPKPALEQARARKNTANRVLTSLKAALNFALNEGLVAEPAPWRLVKPFQKVAAQRVRFLTVEEQQKLVASCDEDLRPLVTAALFTGARYGELTKVRVRDFNGKTLFIQFGKSKGVAESRHIALSQEAIDWFSDLVKGQDRQDLLFRRTEVERTKREDLKGFDGWAPYDQIYAMEKAVKAAGIDPVTFHELRHTYASGLLNQGVPLIYVAEQLGHKDTRMCERHYGHIARTALAETITKLSPKLGLGLKGEDSPAT